MPRPEEGIELLSAYAALGPVAQELLMCTAHRLVEGTAIGDFADDRDYDREALEEAIDLANYVAKRNRQLRGDIERLHGQLREARATNARQAASIERMLGAAAAARTAAQ